MINECGEDFELENLRQAALKSMQLKTTNKPIVINDVQNNNNVQIDRNNLSGTGGNFIKQTQRKNLKNHQFNHQFNNQKQKYNPQFNHQSQFSNQPQIPHQFNHQKFNQPPQFFNNSQFNQQHQFNQQKQFNNQQSFQPFPQFTQPRSNLIVLTAETTNKNDQTSSNYQPKEHYQRNGYNKQINRKFNPNIKKFDHHQKIDQQPTKDVPTDLNKNSDNLPSRFSRIDRDSSSDEDDDELNTDNIEKCIYFTNEDEENTQLSTISKNEEDDDEQNEIIFNLEDENLENDLNTNFNEKIIEDNIDERSLSKSDGDKSKDEFDDIKTDDSKSNNSKSVDNKSDEDNSDESQSNDDKSDTKSNSSNSNYSDSSINSNNKMLKNKKRLNEEDEINLKRLNKGLKKDNSNSPKTSSINELNNDHTKIVKREIKKIVFNKEDFMDNSSNSSNELRFDSEKIRHHNQRRKLNRNDQTKLKSRINVLNKGSIVKLISKKDQITADYEKSTTKKLRSLIVKQ